ncbi:MAG: DUF3106 domain-containing protein [Moraxellaceae bacterium]|nr:DUF3106 domain-containing protein [Moraxellaceae bacterium]MDP1776097.1 DUF3106 domain-containing protein [Moraxellaceae bacterium]MDZ4297379.1 DUF3106 domain-containing protein [Moraxellaceae bacterium]MDZ4386607.1 DUF3106 domain-containing protein [Moraxellaceae bacterium]
MPRNNRFLQQVCTVFALMLTLGFAAPAHAIEWHELSDEQRIMLGDFASRWNDMPVERRERMLDRAERWQAMPQSQREAVRERWNEIKQFPPEVRQALRERWEAMSPEEQREAVRGWKVRKLEQR